MVAEKLSDEQAAFKPNRQSNDNIVIVKNLIERKIKEENKILGPSLIFPSFF